MPTLLQIHITNEDGEILNYWWTDEKEEEITNLITHNLATYDTREDYERANSEDDIEWEDDEPSEEVPDDHERGEN